MSTKTVYQTLEDRNTDLDELESNGPYLCNWKNAWLGNGFYLWESFIANAHWWGKRHSNGYIICQASCDLTDDEYFDLHGNTDHIQKLFNTYIFLKEQNMADEKTTVSRVIQYLKEDLKIFHYKACRACSAESKSKYSEYSFHLNFEKKERSHTLDLCPPIQICFYTKKSLNLRDFKVVFPQSYCTDYVV